MYSAVRTQLRTIIGSAGSNAVASAKNCVFDVDSISVAPASFSMRMKTSLLCGVFVLASLATVLVFFRAEALGRLTSQPQSFKTGRLQSFEIIPLETVSETSSNASIGDLNGDGVPDVVLSKGRRWPLASRVFFGDGKGHFTPGPALPREATTRTYSASLADITKSGPLDIVLSADSPDPKLILLNDGKGNFSVGGSYGDPHWPTRNAAVGDLNGDGYPDIAVANRGDDELRLPQRRQTPL